MYLRDGSRRLPVFDETGAQKKGIGLSGVGPYLAWDGYSRFKWSNVEQNNLFSLSMMSPGSCIERKKFIEDSNEKHLDVSPKSLLFTGRM